MELTIEQKLAAILEVGTLGTSDGKFTFSPNEENRKIFGLKSGWVRTNSDLPELVNSVFSSLISTKRPD